MKKLTLTLTLLSSILLSACDEESTSSENGTDKAKDCVTVDFSLSSSGSTFTNTCDFDVNVKIYDTSDSNADDRKNYLIFANNTRRLDINGVFEEFAVCKAPKEAVLDKKDSNSSVDFLGCS